ncbi:MAG: peptide/nickel transport system ATP-binding protein [Cyclobacteriaceae bacterium]|jgi:peptide/nickel transport system ATP-binding protein
MSSKENSPLLKIQNLNVSYKSKEGSVDVLKNVNLEIRKGEIVAIVGETGSGKTSLGRALLNINPKNAQTTFDEIIFNSDEPFSLSEPKELNKLRGSKISMLFQEPTIFLNPSMKCGLQILEAIMLDEIEDKKTAKQKILLALENIGFDENERIYKSFPNQLSGGECQRIMLVMSTIRNPRLLIADEPSSSVDTLTKEKVFDYFKMLVESRGVSIILITHDLPLALEHAQRIYVMNEGQIVDNLPTENFTASEKSDYTNKLFMNNDRLKNFIPSNERKEESNAFMDVTDLNIYHASSGGRSLFFNKKKHAVINANFSIEKGETLGILGESGSGKTSLAWSLSGLIPHHSGSIAFKSQMSKSDIQMVFQNPALALSPKQKVGQAVEEVILANKKKYGADLSLKLTGEYFDMVGLDSSLIGRLPHELSGGEKQRVCIAKALAAQPQLIILDESVSSLDASVKIEILDLLMEIKNKTGLTYIFISHDLSVIKFVADRVMVMKNGSITTSKKELLSD